MFLERPGFTNWVNYEKQMSEFETEGTVAEVSALAHMFGRDFEVYLSEDGNSPNQIMVSYNKLTNEEPIMLWLKGTEQSFYLLRPKVTDASKQMELLSNTTFNEVTLKFDYALALKRHELIKQNYRLATLNQPVTDRIENKVPKKDNMTE